MVANFENELPSGAQDLAAVAPLLVGVETVAAMISVSTRTVWRLVSAGKLLPPVRIGGAARWNCQRLKQWIEQGCPPVEGGGKQG